MKKVRVWIEWDTGTEAGILDYIRDYTVNHRREAREQARIDFLVEHPECTTNDIVNIDAWNM
jgi:t-SNARE complex subunit (syntaxin)